MHISSLRKQFFKLDQVLLFIAIGFFIIAGSLNNSFKKPPLILDKQETAININKELLIFLSAGNKQLITDLLWVQTLLESDIGHYNKKDLNSWMYLRFLTISYLDARFYENYLFGGQYLSIVKDDLLGAVNLLKRGIEFYPSDYKLRYHLGFTYFYELGDAKNGAKWLESIMDHPKAPSFIRVIVSKLKFESHQNYDVAILFVKDLINSTKDHYLKNKLILDLYALKAEKDLKCLNSKKNNCESLDALGLPYLKINGIYEAQKKFKPYKTYKKNKSI
jgi:hypothetical protein